MNALWLRQDPVLRRLPRWLLWSLAMTFVLLGMAVNLSFHVEKVHGRTLGSLTATATFGFVLWLPAALLLLSRASRRRCSSFDLSLPLAAERLWMRHVIASSLAGALLISILAGIATLVMFLLAHSKDGTLPMPPGAFLQLTATLAVVFALTTAMVQAAAPGYAALPSSRTLTMRRFLLSMAAFAFALLWVELPVVLLLLPLLATGWLIRWARKRLPATWSLESEQEAAAATPSPGTWERAGEPTRGVLSWQWFLLRSLHSGTPKAGMTLWVGTPMLLGFGVLLAGGFDPWVDEEIRWTMLPISIYMLFALFAKPLTFLHPLDALPLPRRHVFALLTLPSLLLLTAGYGAGRLLATWTDAASTPGIRALQTCAGVGVPSELHDIAWEGTVESVVAPWGEAHAPFTAPLIDGWRPVVVSRYCTRDSLVSMDFQIFQASLAAEALYGVIPPQEQLRHLLASTDTATPRRLETSAPPRISSENSVFPLWVALISMGAFGALAIYLRTFRVGRLDRVRKLAFVGLLGMLLALHVAQFALFAFGVTSLWVWDVFWKAGARSLATALPGGVVTLWLLGGLLTWVAYRMAEGQFERAELPVSRGKSHC